MKTILVWSLYRLIKVELFTLRMETWQRKGLPAQLPQPPTGEVIISGYDVQIEFTVRETLPNIVSMSSSARDMWHFGRISGGIMFSPMIFIYLMFPFFSPPVQSTLSLSFSWAVKILFVNFLSRHHIHPVQQDVENIPLRSWSMLT